VVQDRRRRGDALSIAALSNGGKKMKNASNAILTLLVVTFSILLSGCATQQSKFSADTVGQIKTGMTKSQVTATLGEPRSHRMSYDGKEVWQYRKDAQEGKGRKTFIDVVSLGQTSRLDAEFQDILSVFFDGNAVSKVAYEENVRHSNALVKQ
jgi:outer membrane protein assembly factor BamE (lipoprotein component of BamABCDE complex)